MDEHAQQRVGAYLITAETDYSRWMFEMWHEVEGALGKAYGVLGDLMVTGPLNLDVDVALARTWVSRLEYMRDYAQHAAADLEDMLRQTKKYLPADPVVDAGEIGDVPDDDDPF